MNKKGIFLIFIVLSSLTFLSAGHLSNVMISPEAVTTNNYVTYSVTIYNTSGDPINEIQLTNVSGDGDRQFYYNIVDAPNWNFTIASNHLSVTGTPNTSGYNIEAGETLTITISAKVANFDSSGETAKMRVVTKDTVSATDSKQFTITYDTQKPSSPSLQSPANGATIDDVRPTLEWNAVSDSGSGIKSYTLQVSPDDDFIGPGTITKADLTNTSYSIEASEQLSEDTYYWRVYAVDNAGNMSSASTVRSFDVSPVPDLVSPSDNTMTNDPTPLFNWDSVPYAAGYTLQIAEDSGFGTIVLQKTMSATEYELESSESLSNGIYYWRVKTDISSGYSDYYALEVDQSIPNLISPENNAEITDSTPTFEFTEIGSASSYKLQISPSSSFPPESTYNIISEFNTGGPNVTYTMTSALEDGTYYWQVSADGGPYSDYFKFTIGAVAPDTPVLTSPSDNSAIQDTTPAFGWETVTEASSYTLQYKKTTASTWEEKTLIGSTNTSYTVGSPLDESEYKWRVKCRNSKDIESGWSDEWSVIIDKTPPTMPSLGTGWSPSNGEVVEDNTPKFQWPSASDTGSGVEKYTFQYATDSVFSDAATATDLYVSYYTPTVSLENDTYFWRVKAVDKAGNESEYSDSLIAIINVPGQNTVTIVAKSSVGDEIANAAVQLGPFAMSSNSEGRAIFENVPNGSYSLTVSKEEYTSYSDVYDITGNTTIPVTLTSTKKNDVTIIVEDGDGSKIEGAEVKLSPSVGASMSDTTNSQGKVIFTDLESGSYTLEVEKSGFSTYTKTVNVTGDNTFTATIKSRYNLSFTVVDAFEEAHLSGANIKVEELPEKTTDAQGKAMFTLQPGTYNVRVEKEGYDDGTGAGYTKVITVGSDTERTVKLYKAGYDLIVGTIHFGDGSVPYQAVAYQDGKTSSYKTATPNSSTGEFKMEVETGHEYEVGVVGYEDQKVKVVLSQTIDNPKTNPITITNAGSVYGVVSNEIGNVVVGASVKLYTQSDELVGEVTSANKGFTLGDVPPGSYYVKIELQGYKTFISSVFSVKPQERYNLETLQIETQKGSLTVVVQDGDGNKLNAAVRVLRGDELIEEKTAENGEVTFQLIGGSYTVEASLEGYEKGTGTVDVFGGKTVSKNVVLTAESTTTTPPPPETGGLKVTVTDDEGNPVPNVNIFVDNEMKGETDENGTVTMEDIPVGEHQIRLTKAGFADKSFTKTVAAGQTIEESTEISKEEVSKPGRPLWHYVVAVVILIVAVLFYLVKTKRITPEIPKRKMPFKEEEKKPKLKSKPKRRGGLPRKPKT
ncbi:MAG: carboxypeptidase regulatory-like domain-containing protein [Euryarchaeota archaeon]|nr:carboxypeptidase regulatory-like domain-containing protein [Euryarchaeota archaeon]